MIELLVRIKDKSSDDRVKDTKLTKRGDVIAWHHEKQDWGREELSNPEWRIVKANITPEQAEALCSPEYPPDLNKEYKMLQKRAFKLDLDSLGVDSGDVKKRDDSKIPILEKVNIDSVTIQKTRIPELDEIGPVKEHEIGPK